MTWSGAGWGLTRDFKLGGWGLTSDFKLGVTEGILLLVSLYFFGDLALAPDPRAPPSLKLSVY